MRIAFLLLAACLALAVEVPATVKHVTDGDTIAATLADGSEVKVRLLYIDTPESKGNSHGEATAEGKAAACGRPAMKSDPADQLRDALIQLKADSADPFVWLDEIAHAVVELGGGDAVDLLHMKLDDALGDDDPGDPTDN